MSEQPVAAPSEPQAPASAAAPAPQAPQGSEPQGRFIQVPADQLNEFGGRFGDALKSARQHKQAEANRVFEMEQRVLAAGFKSVGDYLDYLDGQQAAAQPPPAQPPVADEPKFLTAEEAEKVMAKVLDQRDQKQTKAQEEAQRTQSFDRARNAETGEFMRLLKSAGFEPPKQGDRNPKFWTARDTLERNLHDLKTQSFRDYAGWSPSLREMKLKEHLAFAGTPEVVQAAMKLTLADLADLRNESVASFAQGQTNIPPATLGGGPAGRPPTPSLDDLPADQKRAEVQRRVKARMQGQR
jgi:hypothetical protein